jgi:hypothetical protein
MMGGVMVKVAVNVIFQVLFFVSVTSAALSAPIPDTIATDSLSERNPLRYHLVTLPSTNKKRVDAMCIKFLSFIPKAMLIPKTVESPVYRLVAYTSDTIEAAKKRKNKLSQQFETSFVAKSVDGYSVIAGSQLTEALAVEEQKRLAGKNLSTTIVELRLPLKQWYMRSTESFTIRDAVVLASKLSKVGVITTIEPVTNHLPRISKHE